MSQPLQQQTEQGLRAPARTAPCVGDDGIYEVGMHAVVSAGTVTGQVEGNGWRSVMWTGIHRVNMAVKSVFSFTSRRLRGRSTRQVEPCVHELPRGATEAADLISCRDRGGGAGG